MSALDLVSRIREALGDNGKRMQDELLDYCRELVVSKAKLEEAERRGTLHLASALAHRACCGTEHDPANGKLHGMCVVCGVDWPCETAQAFLITDKTKAQAAELAEALEDVAFRIPGLNAHDMRMIAATALVAYREGR